MKKIAIYPGTFDPIHNGHVNIIKRASKIFDTLYIGLFNNSSKKAMIDCEKRRLLITKTIEELELKNIKIVSCSGLLVDFLREKRIPYIIRGIRTSSDFDYEFQMAMTNKKLSEYFEIETIFLPSDPESTVLSSSLIRELYRLRIYTYEKYVPNSVREYLKIVNL